MKSYRKKHANCAKCTICGKPIVLVPSATERAKKFGGKPSDYTKLFAQHSTCLIEKRKQETIELMRSMKPSYVIV